MFIIKSPDTGCSASYNRQRRWQQLYQNRGIKQRPPQWLRLALTSLLLGFTCATPVAQADSTTGPAQALLITAPDVAAPISSPQLTEQRKVYADALYALDSRDYDKVRTLLPQLQDYPLQGYLEYRLYRRDLSQLNSQAFQEFAAENADSSLPQRLQNSWVTYLASQQRWQDLLDNFDPAITSAALVCRRLQAFWHTGLKELAMQSVPDLWLVGYSQPQACDPIFNTWIKEGHLTEDMAWQRFWLAIDNNKMRLAKYLTRFLQNKEYKRSAETLLRLHSQPNELANEQLKPEQPGYTSLVTHSLKRLARRDQEQAVNLWQKYNATLTYSAAEQTALKQRLGLSLMKNYETTHADWIKRLDPEYQDELLLEWRLRLHLSQEQWPAVSQLIEHIPDYLKTSNRWRYWQARALSEQGQAETAQTIYQQLAKKRSFYGFLSAQHLGQDFSLNHNPGIIDTDLLNDMRNLPGLLRCRELVYHQQLTEARREWRYISSNFSADEHYHAGLLAHSWGWHTQAIQATIKAKHWDDLKLRFPMLYDTTVLKNAKKFNLEMQLIFAVARQESAFIHDIRSGAGAVGLMQLMPGTAKQTARIFKVASYQGQHSLSNPSTNINLGSAYLSQLLERYNGNRVYATAAYNAGPYRVKGWVEERGQLPIDIWIETIPFDETRQYVQNVLSYTVIYGYMLGQSQAFLLPNEMTQHQHSVVN